MNLSQLLIVGAIVMVAVWIVVGIVYRARARGGIGQNGSGGSRCEESIRSFDELWLNDIEDGNNMVFKETISQGEASAQVMIDYSSSNINSSSIIWQAEQVALDAEVSSSMNVMEVEITLDRAPSAESFIHCRDGNFRWCCIYFVR